MQGYVYSTVPLKKIKTVQFGVFSPEEIVRCTPLEGESVIANVFV
jgi:hypothetical protein